VKLLYVENELVDLNPNTVIAQTLQVFDPGKIGSVVTNYTSAIKLKRTFTNDKIFGFLGNSKSKSEIPYSSLSCKYMENGIPIIRDARMVLNEVNEDQYSFSIYSGPWGFFEIIQDLKLWDLDFSDINGPWDQVVRDGLRTAVTGIVQALVDDGRLVQDQASAAPTIENQGSIGKPPQVYYHTIIEKIFQGFEFEGDIFTNDVYKKLVMPLSVIYNDPAFLNSFIFYAAAPGDQVMINPAALTTVTFDQNVKQGSAGFYDGVSEYVVNNPDTPDRYLKIFFKHILTIEVTGGTVDIHLEATGDTPITHLNKGTGTYESNFGSSVGLQDDDVVRVRIIANSGSPTVTIVSGVFFSYPLTGTDGFEFFPNISVEYVYFQKLFEDITQIDMLRDFCVRFGVQITQINNKIHVNTLNTILDRRSGPDWTFKRNKGPERIKYLFSSYGRTNIIKEPPDSEFTPDITEEYSIGRFEIPNQNLRESFTIYSSIFKPTQMVNTFGVFMLDMNLVPNFANSGRMPGKRLFLVRDKYDFEPDVLYDTVDRSDYLVGYYFDPNQDYDMSWQFFVDTFQQKYIDRCLRRVRLVEREYNLSDLDIFAFNQQVPIWDNGERFLVVKISNRVTRKVAKTELLKIEANPEHFFVSGSANNITGTLEDTMELITDTVPPALEINLDLIENVTGSPTWQCTFDNTQDSEALTAIGDSGSDISTLDHVGELDVDADVLKTNNDGNGTDGFPTNDGWVEWKRNGVTVNTVAFNSASHTSSQGLNFTYLNVVAFEILKVIVHEDGSTP